jgi:hypothetical protein
MSFAEHLRDNYVGTVLERLLGRAGQCNVLFPYFDKCIDDARPAASCGHAERSRKQ